MKKITAVLTTIVLLFTAGCTQKKDNGKISVVCTVFPQYDWIRELTSGLEDKYEITLLTKNGVDIHSYQPSADDIIKLNESDLVVYTGGESDAWVKEYVNGMSGKTAINMLEAVGDNALYDHEEQEPDEHTWLSLDNAEEICEELADALEILDPSGKEIYEQNKELYEAELELLDLAYKLIGKNPLHNTVVVADRFPFRYMMDEYDIKYFAAFSGCSAETEASFETVKMLTEQAEKVPAVLVTDNGNLKLAETVVSNTSDKSKPIISLNSMQSVTSEEIDGGITYLSVMKDNLEVLKQALE